MYTTLRIDKANKVAEVVLNRPEKLNTMTAAFFEEIGRAFSELNEDDEVDVIVLWAEGRMFTAGLDLREAGGTVTGTYSSFQAKLFESKLKLTQTVVFLRSIEGAGLEDKCKAEQNLHFFRLVTKWQEHFEQLRKCKKPVIAAVHNNCIGGGVSKLNQHTGMNLDTNKTKFPSITCRWTSLQLLICAFVLKTRRLALKSKSLLVTHWPRLLVL